MRRRKKTTKKVLRQRRKTKKNAGMSKRIWKSCMSGGKVRPLSSAPVRNINPVEDLGNNGTWEKVIFNKSS